MTHGSDAIRRADDEARRLRRSPADVNRRELQNGSRWTLLQAVGWVATESEDFVRLVGGWTPPGNALPDPDAAQGVRLMMSHILRNLLAPALSFAKAQMHLLTMLNAGDILIYVEHVECVPCGSQFTTLTYNSDFTGLHPAPDDRYWGYVVVEAESLRLAWAALRSSSIAPNAPALAIAAEQPAVIPASPLTTAALLEVVDRCVRDRLGVEPTRRAIDEAFPGNRLTRLRVRNMHAERWELAYKQAPNRGANTRK